jgi:hypothetical protein
MKSSLLRDEIRLQMRKKYLSNPDYNFEKVNRASLACGPMVKWAIAQVGSSLLTKPMMMMMMSVIMTVETAMA